ncbi:MAG: hypothetical protein AYK18_08790 [Theionarchaea archaeon DG-70]|nr:MAG: hypothetical protein AYK18_08790 [Theionarchaea archaeon DG-70]
MKAKRISKLTQKEKHDIEQLIDLCTFSTPFLHPDWLLIVEDLFNENMYYAFHYDECETMEFALPFILKKSYRYWDMHSFSMAYELNYGGPLCNSYDVFARLAHDMLMLDGLERVKSLSIYLPPTFDCSAFGENRCIHIYNTPIIDLTPDLDSLWNTFPYKNVRCNINKARKHNIHVVVDEKQHLRQFHEYHAALLNSFNKPILPLQYYESVAQLPYVHIFSALYDKYPIAVGIILTHHNTVYYWNNASASEYRTYRPNDLLVWEIMKWAKEHNFHVFDFLIVPLDELPGLSRFKLKFRPKLYPIYEYRAKNKYQIMSKGLYYLSRPYEIISKLCSTFIKSS